VNAIYHAFQVEVFGSMKTGLYLPTSDIDLVVFHNMDQTPFYEIRNELISREICTDRTIKVLDGASVCIEEATFLFLTCE
jgi:non-canonical poly(A) RNA polymerase PAPD5/7